MTSTTITTTINGTYTVTTDDLLITSSGTITAANSSFAVIDSGAIGTLTNDGTISGGGGISAASISSLTNNGNIISSKAGNTTGDGVKAGTIGTLTNTGNINAVDFAISAGSGGIGTFTNSGTLSATEGGSRGISDSGNLTSLDNAAGGRIAASSAINVSGSIGTLTNAGSISGGNGSSHDGVAANSIGLLINTGTISGDNAIYGYGLASVNNEAGGAISGKSDGIKLFGSIGTLTNEGSIHGNEFGIFVTGSANIENAGTIGGGAEAIQFYGANSTLTLDPTSVINGNVSDGASGGTLVLGGSSTNTVTGIGSKYSGFKTISFDNANATAEGSASGLANSQTITGFTTGDAIKLDSFAAVSETYTAGTGLILTDTNSNTETLHITGSYTAANFAFASDGTNTTITDPTITISTSITTQVVVGAADNLVVTSSGTISTSGTAVAASASIGTISNGGSIASTAYAIVDAGNLASLDNAASGVIGGDGGNAIYVSGSIGVLTNEGGITVGHNENAIQAGSIGTLTNTGTIGGGRLGVSDNGSLTSMDNAAAGVINTTGTAIEVSGTLGTLTNEGVIHGGGRGIVVGTANIENAGTITAASLAIQFTGANSTLTIDPTSVISGTVLDQNSGGTLVLGGSSANTVTGIGTQYIGFATISFHNADATAEGSISGLAGTQTITGFTDGDSIKLDSFSAVSGTYVAGTGLILTNASSNTETLDIAGSYTTANFDISSNGSTTTITDPTITISSSVTTGVNVAAGENLVVTSAGTITVTSNAVVVANGISAISNSGQITSHHDSGIYDGYSLASIDNTALASIVGGETGIEVLGTIGTLTNEGTISGAKGVFVQGLGTITNSGNISGGAKTGIEDFGTVSTLTNEGTISGGASGQGIYATGVGTITNSGSISGGRNGIYVSGSNGIGAIGNTGQIVGRHASGIYDRYSLGSADNAAHASIVGNATGIEVFGTIGTLTNEGTISGAKAIFVQGSGTITNSGTISAGAYSGIEDFGTLSLLTNEGTISGGVSGQGIYATGLGTLTNRGDISGGRNGLYVSGTIGTLTNKGTISGASYNGIYVTGTASIENAGTISGSSSAIDVQGAGSTLTLDPTSVIDGLVEDTAGDGTLVLAGSTANTVTGIGTQYTGFATISFDNANATAEGSTSGLADGQTITGFADGDSIDVENFAAISETYVTGTGLILTNASSNTETLNIAGSYTTANFDISSNGSTTTITDPTITIASTVTTEFTVGSTENLVVTSAGVVNATQTAVGFTNAIGAISNSGTISGGGAFGIVDNTNLASIDNAANASIYGGSTGVEVYGTIGTLTNEGSIIGGTTGIHATGIGTLTNSGTISGGYIAIDVQGVVGALTNEAAIEGYIGIVVADTANIENAGTISGAAGAIYLEDASSTLILDPTSVIDGSVLDQAGDGTLVLAGSTANTVTGIGTQYTGFATISFDNANATAEGSTSGLAGTNTITGFTTGDTIKLDGFAAVSETYTAGTGLILTNASSNTETLNITGSYTTQDFQISNDGTNTTITDTEPLCFLPGTLILTPTGEIPVEDLRIGDSVTTLDGKARPIRWIGHGCVLSPAGRRGPATPVLIRRGALADKVPHSDLYVTKGHALYLNGALIPAEFLVNHRSILWDDRGQEVRFYHIELDGHEILRANGAPAESYRDEANRWMFANANPAWDQPGVAPFAPVLTGGPRVDAAWRHLLERSGIGLNLPTTGEPDLHLLVDGARVEAISLTREVYSFALPAGARRIAIASRASAPDVLGVFRDPRRLGVAVSRIVLWQDGAPHIIDADDDALTEGFHGYEPEEGCRWTNGHGMIPSDALPWCSAPQAVQLYIRHSARYAVPADWQRKQGLLF